MCNIDFAIDQDSSGLEAVMGSAGRSKNSLTPA
jgi:hypothetical protein